MTEDLITTGLNKRKISHAGLVEHQEWLDPGSSDLSRTHVLLPVDGLLSSDWLPLWVKKKKKKVTVIYSKTGALLTRTAESEFKHSFPKC